MPFKSQAQAKWMWANNPQMAQEWASKTKSIKKLPVYKSEKAVWDTPDPTKSDHHLGKKKLKSAKARARAAGRPYPNLIDNMAVSKFDTPAWTRSEGKNPHGGLNAKGRASARAEGHNLKPPVKSGNNPRRKSFLSRMGNMPGPEHKPNGEPTRLLLSLNAWGASSKADARRKAAAMGNVNKGLPSALKQVSPMIVHNGAKNSPAQEYMATRIKRNVAGKSLANIKAGGSGVHLKWSMDRAENLKPIQLERGGESLGDSFFRRVAPKIQQSRMKSLGQKALRTGRYNKSEGDKILASQVSKAFPQPAILKQGSRRTRVTVTHVHASGQPYLGIIHPTYGQQIAHRDNIIFIKAKKAKPKTTQDLDLFGEPLQKSMIKPGVYKPAHLLSRSERLAVKTKKLHAASHGAAAQARDAVGNAVRGTPISEFWSGEIGFQNLSTARKHQFESLGLKKVKRNVYVNENFADEHVIAAAHQLPKMRRPTIIHATNNLPPGAGAVAGNLGSKSSPRFVLIPKGGMNPLLGDPKVVLAHEAAHANTKRSIYGPIKHKVSPKTGKFDLLSGKQLLEEARADRYARKITGKYPLNSYRSMATYRPIKHRKYIKHNYKLWGKENPTGYKATNVAAVASTVGLGGYSANHAIKKSMEYDVPMNQSRFGGASAVAKSYEEIEKGVRLERFAGTKAGKRWLQYEEHALPKFPKRDKSGIPYLEARYSATKKAKKDALIAGVPLTGLAVYGGVNKAELAYDAQGNPVPQRKPLMSGNAKLAAAGTAIGGAGIHRVAFANTLPGKLQGQANAAADRTKFQQRMLDEQVQRVQDAHQIKNPITRRKQVRLHTYYANNAEKHLSQAQGKEIIANHALASAPAKRLAHIKSGTGLIATGGIMGGLAAYNNAKERKLKAQAK